MTREVLTNEYFDWMYDLVCDRGKPYRRLLRHLHDIEFVYSIPMDDNRAMDGINLRYRFAYERNYNYAMVAEYLDNRPCSVLEMMVALVHKCEEQIMENPEFGNRTRKWFYNMLVSLGLESMTDATYNEHHVDVVIVRFLNRDYKPNGEGGLFTVENYRRDMRVVEIWYQMCWFLDEVLYKEKR